MWSTETFYGTARLCCFEPCSGRVKRVKPVLYRSFESNADFPDKQFNYFNDFIEYRSTKDIVIAAATCSGVNVVCVEITCLQSTSG